VIELFQARARGRRGTESKRERQDGELAKEGKGITRDERERQKGCRKMVKEERAKEFSGDNEKGNVKLIAGLGCHRHP
jgi:hypothetical protein